MFDGRAELLCDPLLASANLRPRLGLAHLSHIWMRDRMSPDGMPGFLQRAHLLPSHHHPVIGLRMGRVNLQRSFHSFDKHALLLSNQRGSAIPGNGHSRLPLCGRTQLIGPARIGISPLRLFRCIEGETDSAVPR